MATKSPTQHHNHWGQFGGPTLLPNVSGSPTQDAALEVGDIAYSVNDATMYQCDTATLGAAVWSAMGGGGAPISSVGMGAGDYTYTQAAQPVEEVVGNGAFNGSLVGSATAYFKAAVTNSWQQTGGGETTRVRLYDMGPAAGPPDVTPRLVSELTFTAQGGPRSAEQALTVVSSTPGTNDILDQDRMYELAIIQDPSAQGDVAYLGSAGLEVR